MWKERSFFSFAAEFLVMHRQLHVCKTSVGEGSCRLAAPFHPRVKVARLSSQTRDPLSSSVNSSAVAWSREHDAAVDLKIRFYGFVRVHEASSHR